MIQHIVRHSNVATTQNHDIKSAPDDIAAMKRFSAILMSLLLLQMKLQDSGDCSS
jgi:hypothetical protein